MLEFLFNKVACLISTTLLRKRLWHRCFPVNFMKFLETSISENAFGRLLLACHKCFNNVFWLSYATKRMNSESFKLVVSISGNDQTRAQYKLCCIFFEGKTKKCWRHFRYFYWRKQWQKIIFMKKEMFMLMYPLFWFGV